MKIVTRIVKAWAVDCLTFLYNILYLHPMGYWVWHFISLIFLSCWQGYGNLELPNMPTLFRNVLREKCSRYKYLV